MATSLIQARFETILSWQYSNGDTTFPDVNRNKYDYATNYTQGAGAGKSKYVFAPSSRSVTLGPSQSGIDFSGSTTPPAAPSNLVAVAQSATTVLLTAQAPTGAMKLAVKFVVTPGARLLTVNTVPGEDWLFTTVTLFNVTLPELLTLPL